MAHQVKIQTGLDRDAWLAARLNNVSSTEVPALFGLSPYTTPLELFYRKEGMLVDDFAPNDRMRWGTRLERAISNGLAEDNNWEITSLEGTYMSLPEIKLGASFDNSVICPIRGKGLAEIKNVDFIQFRDQWNEKGDEAPDWIELQLQTQMLVADVKWGCVAALVGGNALKVFIRERDDEIGNAIINKVKAFWASIEANNPPPIDFKRDYDILAQIYDKRDKTKIVELPDLESKLVRYQEITQQANDLEAEKNEIKCLLLAQSDEAGRVFSGSMQASIARAEGSPDVVWTREMAEELIGETKKGRASYNRITINQRKIK